MLSPAPILGNHVNVANASRVRKFRYIQARKGIVGNLEVMFRILSGIRKSSGYPFGSRTAADFDKCSGVMARPEGFEPPTFRFVVYCSIQLSYGRMGRNDFETSRKDNRCIIVR